MRITYDPGKRTHTLQTRGLDFLDAAAVFAGKHLTGIDDRQNYGERRYITAGYLASRIVIVVWTPRGDARHVIPMRKANEREIGLYPQQLSAGR